MTTFLPTKILKHEARLHALHALLEIPRSADQQARDRYGSFAEHLHRPESTLRKFNPRVFSQGSFNLGTTIRPLAEDEEYDIDVVVELELLGKESVTQKRLSELMGVEACSYSAANNFKEPAVQKACCWRLPYASDKLKFHLDAVQTVPESAEVKQRIASDNVTPEIADRAIAITCQHHPHYGEVCFDWTTGNPHGFAIWFRARMEPTTGGFIQKRTGATLASIENLQTYEVKTPLQQAVQLLKRHRNVHFRDAADRAPASILITSLCAHAYEGEPALDDAMTGILTRMEASIRPTAPRVPNPTNLLEDFASRWSSDSSLEEDFRRWLEQAKGDFRRFGDILQQTDLIEAGEKAFAVRLPEESARDLAHATVPTYTGALIGAGVTPAKPWGEARR